MSEEINIVKDSFKEKVIYYPKIRPGYTAWACLFKFGNGDLGISFNEIRLGKRKDFTAINLEFLAAMSLPYRICPDIFPASNPDLLSEYVYLKSTDGGKNWTETGRCEVDTRHYWTVGYPDGRMVRLIGTQEYRYEIANERHCAIVEESCDGGNTWKEISKFLEGYFFYGHKFKKLKNGDIIAAGPVLPSFGADGQVPTRNYKIPNEFSPWQTAFMYSNDKGYTWTGPHYILAGAKAWEPDFVELNDGSLLFVNSTVQAGPAVTQVVRKISTGFVNESLQKIKLGAGDRSLQGGYTPETLTLLDNGVIVGARRVGVYSCSSDLGQNWHQITGLPNCKYQPVIETVDDGRIMAVWHEGGDTRFGEVDMFIGTHEFKLQVTPPKTPKLILARNLSADGSKYENSFSVTLTCDGQPLAERDILFKICPVRLEDNTRNPIDVYDSKDIRAATTDDEGKASIVLPEMDKIPEIHYSYWIAASFAPKAGDKYNSIDSGALMVYAMTQQRSNPAPYPIYMIQGIIMLRPDIAAKYPEIIELVKTLDKDYPDISCEDFKQRIGDEARGSEILDFLQSNNILQIDDEGICRWYRRHVFNKNLIRDARICELKEYVQ